ncbi:Aste57867_13333 [Aphanomyces stellatus]|uniref:Aste57867_13333 protein n=1 Tax=Aphanomyces stellatus TaxID=120398 RepID=A0A485KZW9_9STRA|nr:hypothetical protein As57867_013284 [Aphanomyces stellatus]VFT90172.1 Aste57867_13333 [Aphanomyces stellatus]
MKRVSSGNDADLHPLLQLPSAVLLKITKCLPDAPSAFAFLDILGTVDVRGDPLEHLWQLGQTCDQTDLWPDLRLGKSCCTHNQTIVNDLVVVISHYRRVVLEGEFNVKWLLQHLNLSTSVECKSVPDDWDPEIEYSAAWYAQWAQLHITKVNVSLLDWNPLVTVLPNLQQSLTELAIQYSSDSHLAPITAFLATSSITKLSLECLRVMFEAPAYSVQMLRDLICWLEANQVRSLTLDPCRWDDQAICRDWIAAVFTCPTLKELQLSDCMVSPLPTITSSLVMRYLQLNLCYLTATDIVQLSVGLLDSKVERLSLAQTNREGTEDGFKILLEALPRSKVTHLDLSYCELDDQTLVALAPLLPPTRLELLVLDGNPITNAGVSALASAIRISSTIQNLSLRDCTQITVEGILALVTFTSDRLEPMKKLVFGATDNIAPKDIESIHLSAKTLGVEHLDLFLRPGRFQYDQT